TASLSPNPADYPSTSNSAAFADTQLDGVATLLSPTITTPPAGAIAASAIGVAGTLRTHQDTEFKLSTQPSQTLPATQKVRVKSGSAFGLQAYMNAENQHLRVTFNQGLGPENRNTWFVFAPHIELISRSGQAIVPTPPASLQIATARAGEIRLPVPYFSQRDNMQEAFRTCNTSSCAMVAKFLGAKISGDDEFFQVVTKYGDTTDHSVQTRALAEIGIQSTWNTDLNFDALDQSLKAGLPAVIGILHRGPLEAPTGGHMIVVIGRTASGDYIINDPFGNLLDDYSSSNGGGIVYPRNVLQHRWTPDGNNSGWGRLFYGNSSPSVPASLQPAPSKGISSILSILSQQITTEQLIQIAGADAPRDRLRNFTSAINQTLEKYQINTPLRIAHFLAQVMHESGGFQYLREIWGPTDWQIEYEGRQSLGNTQPGDGKRFMGRGLIQLTGRANYAEFSKAMNVDFLSKPELVEQSPYAVLVAGWYWNSRDINTPADRDDLEEVTRRINGGTLGIAERATYLQTAKSVLKC
ncbi:MAG: C39 family peptidase, partial [Kovacikia sp.]